MLIDGKKYSYRQLIEATGLSRSTLHRRIKALKQSGVPLTMGAIFILPRLITRLKTIFPTMKCFKIPILTQNYEE